MDTYSFRLHFPFGSSSLSNKIIQMLFLFSSHVTSQTCMHVDHDPCWYRPTFHTLLLRNSDYIGFTDQNPVSTYWCNPHLLNSRIIWNQFIMLYACYLIVHFQTCLCTDVSIISYVSMQVMMWTLLVLSIEILTVDRFYRKGHPQYHLRSVCEDK